MDGGSEGRQCSACPTWELEEEQGPGLDTKSPGQARGWRTGRSLKRLWAGQD